MRKQLYSKYILIFSDLFSFSFSLFFSVILLLIFTENIEVYIPFYDLFERLSIHFFLVIFGIAWFWIRLRHYTYRKPFWFELKEILRTLIILSVIELAIIGFSKLYFSRYLWVLIWVSSLFFVPLSRVLIKKWLIKKRIYIKRTIVIGGGSNAIDAYNALKSEPYLGLNVKYFFTDNPSPELERLGVSIIKNINDGIWKLISNEFDQFIIALEEDEAEKRNYWLRYLAKCNYRSVSVIPSLRGLPLYSTDISFLFSYDVILLRINHNLAKRSARLLKRTFDILGSTLIMVMLSPLLISLYFIIKKDGGNAIYGHERIGRNGKPFKCLKFRSMVINSKEVLEELLRNDPEAREEWEKDFKLKNDPRITKIGHFLRKTSLDELPQLWNVLKGEMSLVGPRPIVQEELERYQEDVSYYLMAKPGMTGLWQVSGRNDVDYTKRVYFDSWYVKNWSLWNDIAILFKTIRKVFAQEGAY